LDSGLSGISLTVTSNASAPYVNITVTGLAATNITWGGTITFRVTKST
jgi:hypothetical protein